MALFTNKLNIYIYILFYLERKNGDHCFKFNDQGNCQQISEQLSYEYHIR